MLVAPCFVPVPPSTRRCDDLGRSWHHRDVRACTLAFCPSIECTSWSHQSG
ncbi:hypothetical protein GBAR_LOCUS16976 [Geodia barretti]|uniref:Uncharacterized protein n=1 Tax=Geodia barretti TaxID=519541 RepID=A0AA35SHV8_GEOBA|nr:hypothetical protein GBAR_LOCUS16976 [Geodia barretti]